MCILQVVESLLPDILGEECFQSLQQYTNPAARTSQQSLVSIPEEMQRQVEDCTQEWMSAYADESYVSPLLLFSASATTSSNNSNNNNSSSSSQDKESDQKKKLEDVKKLVDLHNKVKVTAMENRLRGNSVLDNSNKVLATWQQLEMILGPSDLLKPLKSIETPFAQPLPSPLLPFTGYEDDNEPLTAEEEAEVLQYLHAELIWLTPSNLRLVLLPEDEQDDKEAERFCTFRDILRTQAFSKPLAHKDQRMAMELLNGGRNRSNNPNNSNDRTGAGGGADPSTSNHDTTNDGADDTVADNSNNEEDEKMPLFHCDWSTSQD